MIDLLQQIFYLIVVLGVLVFVHELGHFLVAKYFKVRVEVFSLGFGRRIFGFRRGETEYRVAWIPLGGYVKMAGELFADPEGVEPDHFTAKPRWQRLLVLVAGPAMNVALAILLWWGLFWSGAPMADRPEGPPVVQAIVEGSPAARAGIEPGDRILAMGERELVSAQEYEKELLLSPGREVVYTIERAGERRKVPVEIVEHPSYFVGLDGVVVDPIVVGAVQEGSPAARAGLEAGDRIELVDGRPVGGASRFVEIVQGSEGRALELGIVRDGERRSLNLAAEYVEEADTWRIGIQFGFAMRQVEGPGEALRVALDTAKDNALLLPRVLGRLISGALSPKVLSGPLEIARVSEQAAEQGFMTFVQLLAFISLQLGLFNLLPIPVLDGGQMLILAAEASARRDLPMRIKERILQAGFFFVIAFAIAVLSLDVYKRFTIPSPDEARSPFASESSEERPAASSAPAEPVDAPAPEEAEDDASGSSGTSGEPAGEGSADKEERPGADPGR